MYLLITTCILGGLFAYFDGHTIVKEKITSKYHDFRSLNKLVGTQYKNSIKIIWVSICMVAKMYWMNFLQWSNNTIEYHDKKTAIISYVLNGKLYRFCVQAKKGPPPILMIVDQNGEDCTDLVLPFMGPKFDWHGGTYTPSFWDKDILVFEVASGEEKTFQKEDVIVV